MTTNCRYCKKPLNEQSMMEHYVQIHPKKMDARTCGICNHLFSSPNSMLEHQKSHKHGSYIQCRSCPKKLLDKVACSVHSDKCH